MKRVFYITNLEKKKKSKDLYNEIMTKYSKFRFSHLLANDREMICLSNIFEFCIFRSHNNSSGLILLPSLCHVVTATR